MENEMNQYFELKRRAELNGIINDVAEALLKNLQREIEEYKRKHHYENT